MFDMHPDLSYLDSAATALTPRVVLDKMDEYYSQYGTNVSRGVYALCEEATSQYEDVRVKAATFIGADSPGEIVFTSSTTHAINMIAQGLPLDTDSSIVVSAMDHHANFVPWQVRASFQQIPDKGESASANFKVVGIGDDYLLDLEDVRVKVAADTAVLALPLVSNVLGTVNPIAEIVRIAKDINPTIIIVVDAAQAAPHIRIDVEKLGCDFLVFSAHKAYGPTGAGILWGKKGKLEMLTPLLSGGDMIAEVTSAGTTYRDLPHRLEAGTPNIAGVLGMGRAIDYIQDIGFDNIAAHEDSLMNYTLSALGAIEDLTLYGPDSSRDRIGVFSFSLENIHPHDIASILDQEVHVAIRAGNHCAMPLHTEHLHLPATARISLGIYNDKNDIDKCIEGLQKAKSIFTN